MLASSLASATTVQQPHLLGGVNTVVSEVVAVRVNVVNEVTGPERT